LHSISLYRQRYGILGIGNWVLGARYWVLDAGCWMSDEALGPGICEYWDSGIREYPEGI